ncbi:ROK family protein [Naasia lichenicola]|uniref:ROK family protein n=1 Tax=Naasia lichenicola TaxID=2565933 RepID=A0A4S4FSB6_9MICO|nr:ROK family protein [Naasia lichenicola]THG32376.1 ROK family protein [Naasia lichenicola]
MRFALAVDLGGTKVEAALVSEDAVVLARSRRRAPTGPDSTHASLSAALSTVIGGALGELPSGSGLTGIGIGSAGPLDLDAGTVSPLNLPGCADFPLRRTVSAARPELPVHLALDGLCITLAEHWVGAAVGRRSVLGMVVSTGIGGGIVMDGRPLLGGTGNAGHIGQVTVPGYLPEGVGGLPATSERLASGPNIVGWARELGWQGRTGEELAAAYAGADPLAVAAVRRSASAVGAVIASASALLDLDVVVIGGGFVAVSPDYLALVREARDQAAPFPFVARAEIVPSGLGGDGPLLGAAALVLRSA